MKHYYVTKVSGYFFDENGNISHQLKEAECYTMYKMTKEGVKEFIKECRFVPATVSINQIKVMKKVIKNG